jgi:TonB-dependent receptor
VSDGGSNSGYSGSSGNPGLKPLESENFDLMAEWYYDEGSYVSLGFFRKDVSNWISTGYEQSQIFGLYNPLSGDKVDAARAALGASAGNAAIRAYILTNYAASPYVNPTPGGASSDGEIIGDPSTDDLVTFNVSVPVNSSRSEVVTGWEFNVQHLLGDTGFGGILNYTVVDTGLQYDVNSVADTEAIVGLGDTANVVAFYDKNGLQARIAYNWRDRFLSERRTGPDGDETSPLFTQPYRQIDFSVSYDLPILEGATVFLEGINITENDVKIVGRREAITQRLTASGARYNIGMRYIF